MTYKSLLTASSSPGPPRKRLPIWSLRPPLLSPHDPVPGEMVLLPGLGVATLELETEGRYEVDLSWGAKASVYNVKAVATIEIMSFVPDMPAFNVEMRLSCTLDELRHLIVDRFNLTQDGDFRLSYKGTEFSEEDMLKTWGEIGAPSPILFVHDPLPMAVRMDKLKCGPNIQVSEDGSSAKCLQTNQWSTVRATAPISSGIHTWEVKIVTCVSGYIFFGVCTEEATFDAWLGEDSQGWGYLGDASRWSDCKRVGDYGKQFRANDRIQVTMDMDKHELSFVKNGDVDMGVAFYKLPAKPLYPAFALLNPGDEFNIIGSAPTVDTIAPGRLLSVLGKNGEKLQVNTGSVFPKCGNRLVITNHGGTYYGTILGRVVSPSLFKGLVAVFNHETGVSAVNLEDIYKHKILPPQSSSIDELIQSLSHFEI